MDHSDIAALSITPWPFMAQTYADSDDADRDALLFTLHAPGSEIVATQEYAHSGEEAPSRVRVCYVRSVDLGNERTRTIHTTIGWLRG